MTAKQDLTDIDPAAVTGVRTGNQLYPGLACFTGVTFFVYLLVKAASGAVAFDMALVAQVAAAAAMGGIGAGLLVRGRYFFVVLETAAGPRRINGLSKAEQRALAARYGDAA